MIETRFSYAELAALLDGRPEADVACPLCGLSRLDPRNRTRVVLRLWSLPNIISFHCARCGESGYVHEDERRPVDHEAIRRARAVIDERDRVEAGIQHRKALGMWSNRQQIRGSIAEGYLREVRGITCELPPTLGFLPARDAFPPAMMAAFGMATETEPGVLSIADEAVRGVHLTRLRPDGSGKAEEPAKIMLGRSKDFPIVLAPMNDLLGLLIAKGIEDALSMHQATGLGAWAAGAASRMPALADAVSGWVGGVTVLLDDDEAGRRHAPRVVEQLVARGVHAELNRLGATEVTS